MIEEGHGGKDGAPNRNDVELGNVVVLEDTLGHLQPIGRRNLKFKFKLTKKSKPVSGKW